MRAGENESAIFLQVIRSECGRYQSLLVGRRNAEFYRTGKLGNGDRVNRDATHLKSVLVEPGGDGRGRCRKQNGLLEIFKVAYRRSEYIIKILLCAGEHVKERDGERCGNAVAGAHDAGRPARLEDADAVHREPREFLARFLAIRRVLNIAEVENIGRRHPLPYRLQHRQPSRPRIKDANHCGSAFTRFTNWSPRSYSFLNMPNEAKAGERRMVSPGCADANASRTALSRVSKTDALGMNSSTRLVPVPASRMTRLTSPSFASSAFISRPLSAPPMIRTT